MSGGVKTIIYPHKDLDTAKALFTALFEDAPEANTPYDVGWKPA
jgi:hypothetical protein